MISGTVSWLKTPGALTVAAGLVGVAILLDGSVARVFNGVGGILWIASCAAMIRTRINDPQRWTVGSIVVVLAIVLAVVVRPSDGGIAVIGFGVAAAVIAQFAAHVRVAWCAMLPAAWLPVHLGIAIGKVAWRGVFGGESTVRTDPPPTTAVVPLLMVITAWGVGLLISRLKDGESRRREIVLRSR